MEKLRHGSLFSGIGGFDLAAEWMGWENVFHCEWNDFGQKVLKHYWPNAESFSDITKTDFTKYYGTVDIITGGFPCQPYSSAGKRKGKEDERHLWPEMLRAIREVSPRFVVGENVRGLTNWNGGLVFDEVCAELESLGYQVAPVIIPACALNAPHKRERIWFVAYSKSVRWNGGSSEHREEINKNISGVCKCGQKRCEMGCEFERYSQEWPTTNTTSIGFCGDSSTEQSFVEASRTRKRMGEKENGNASNTERVRRLQSSKNIQRKQPNGIKSISFSWQRNVTNTKCEGLFRLHETGKENNIDRKDSKIWGGVTRYNQKNDWEEFPTQSPVCGGNDGFSTELDGITFPKWRSESIKAYGNAIVPQVAYEIFKALEKSLYL